MYTSIFSTATFATSPCTWQLEESFAKSTVLGDGQQGARGLGMPKWGYPNDMPGISQRGANMC